MKILVYCYEFPPLGGGAGNALKHLAEQWARLGHAVTVVTSHYQGMSRVEFLNGVKVTRLSAGRKQLHEGRKWEMLLFGLKATFLAESVFRSERPDVCVVFMTVPGGGLAPFFLKWFHKVPFITEIRGADMPGYDASSLKFHHWVLQPFIRFSWKQSRSVICVNRMFAGVVKKNCPLIPSVVSIPNGVDGDFYTPSFRERPREDLNILFAGRFVDSQKNITTLLSALAGTDGVILHLAGGGPDENKLKSYADKLGVSEKVRFLGWLDKRSLLAAYRSADVYVSAASSEGMPNTALEAMACGLPLLLSDIPGHDELIEEGKNGRLFPENNPERLTQLIADLQKDRSLREEMGRQSRRKALEKHDWGILAKEHLDRFFKPRPETSSKKITEVLTANFFFLGFIFLSVFCMKGAGLSDDQITYLSTAKRILGSAPAAAHWLSTDLFSCFLGAFYRLTGDYLKSFLWIYGLTAVFYLNAMYWSLGYFIKDKKIRMVLSLASIVPHYTLGMTYWGFAGFEYVKSRILFMPLAAVVLRRFFEWERTEKIWVPLVLCAAGGLLSFEAFYLLAILTFYLIISYLRQKDRPRPVLRAAATGIIAGIFIMVLVYCLNFLPGLTAGNGSALHVEDVYRKIIFQNKEIFSGVSRAGYIASYWHAAYEGFWWTMFPPRWIDVFFAAFNSIFLILFGVWGALIQRKEAPDSFLKNIRFIFCVIITAYLYQTARFIGWKIFNAPPHILEEVRAVKFLFFPVFLFIGTFLLMCLRQQRFKTLLLATTLLFVSPLELLRNLPEKEKESIAAACSAVLKDWKYQDYARKALEKNDPRAAAELGRISDILEAIGSKEGRAICVLSDRHELQASGQNVFITYQDKRWFLQEVESKYYETLPYWDHVFHEISEVLASRDPERLAKTAAKYGCRYAVTDFNVPSGSCLYKGKVYSLHRFDF